MSRTVSVEELLLSTAFRRWPDAYGERVLTGFPAVVTKVEGGKIHTIDHNLFRVNEWEQPMASFCLTYTPDLRVTPDRAARELRNGHSSTQLACTDGLKVRLERFIEELRTKMTTKKTEAPRSKPTAVRVYADFHRRTCLMLSRADGQVRHIPMSALGFEVETVGTKEFDGAYKELSDYPADRAARLYAEYARHLGGSPEAMRELARLTTITPKDIEMATTKKAATAATTKAAKDKAAASAKPKAKAPPADKPKAKAPPADKPKAKAPPAKKEPAERKPTASSMIRELIMEGKLPDSKIFEKVQKAYGLSDDKKWYPKWYRADLVKKAKAADEAKKGSGVYPPESVPEK